VNISSSVAALILEAQREADALSVRKLDKQGEQRFAFLLNKISTLRQGIAEDSAKIEREEFRQYLKACPQVSAFALEQRTYSPLTEPSGIVPASYFKTLMTGVAQYTDLMKSDVIRLITVDDARPMTVPALDLSQCTATIVGQGVDNPPSAANPVAGSMSLGSFTYRASPVAASIELEQDSFESISEILNQAFSVGLARKIGSDLINGDGTTAPMGLLNAAGDSGVTTATAGVLTAADIKSIYFSLNRAYRVSSKCAWLMHEDLYEQLRGEVDSAGRPLINITEDTEKLYGKRIILSPDMPTDAGSKGILFGDLSQYVVRVNRSSTRVTRSFQAPGYAEMGSALYTAWTALDAKLNTVNSVKPVIYATLHS